MLALRVVEHLDVLEHVLPCSFPGHVGAAADAFALEELEEAFRDGIVVSVAAAAHAGFEIVLAKEHLPLAAGELRSLVGTDHHLVFGLRLHTAASRACRARSVVMRGLGRPADHPAREQINHHRQIQPPLVGLDVGDVGHPDLVGRIHLELPVQGVGCGDSRLAAISPWATLVANLGQDACKAGQPGDPVLGNLLPQIAQIVSELAIAIDLATVGPGLPDQFRLACIVPRTAA